MSLEQFDAHLSDPAPGFRCYAAGDRGQTLAFLARVRNIVGKPGTVKAIEAVKKMCGSSAPALMRFVEAHDGVVLFRDTKSDDAGMEFFKTTASRARTKEMRESMVAMGFHEDEMPEWFREGIVFGEIPHSANYFVIQSSGDAAGQIVYCDHDDFREKPLAASFEELLGMIVADPPGFLYQRGCYTRYSDGKSDVQWIPKQYVPDCNVG